VKRIINWEFTSLENIANVVHLNNYSVFYYHNQQVYRMENENLDIVSHLVHQSNKKKERN